MNVDVLRVRCGGVACRRWVGVHGATVVRRRMLGKGSAIKCLPLAPMQLMLNRINSGQCGRYSRGIMGRGLPSITLALHHPSSSNAALFSTTSISSPSLKASSSSLSSSGSKSYSAFAIAMTLCFATYWLFGRKRVATGGIGAAFGGGYC